MSDADTCEICEAKVGKLTVPHVEAHGITVEDYKNLFPGSPPPIEPETDPIKILGLLKDAILNKNDYDKHDLAGALKQTLDKYETKNRIFLIAAANAELPRIVRLLTFINKIEKEIFDTERVADATTKDLLRMYTLAQTNLLTGVDNVKKVADMRLEFLKAGSGEGGIGDLFEEEKQLNALRDLPGLDPQKRDKVRNTVEGLLRGIERDDSLQYEGDEEE